MITRQGVKKPGKHQTPATASPPPPPLPIPPFHCRHVCCATLAPPPCYRRKDPRGDMLVWVGQERIRNRECRRIVHDEERRLCYLRTSIWGNSLSPPCPNVHPLAPDGDPFPKSQLPQSPGALSNNEEDPSMGNWQRVRLPSISC